VWGVKKLPGQWLACCPATVVRSITLSRSVHGPGTTDISLSVLRRCRLGGRKGTALIYRPPEGRRPSWREWPPRTGGDPSQY